MPRTVEEILARADDLDGRFEAYEPDPRDEIDPDAIARRAVGRGRSARNGEQASG